MLIKKKIMLVLSQPTRGCNPLHTEGVHILRVLRGSRLQGVITPCSTSQGGIIADSLVFLKSLFVTEHQNISSSIGQP
jgi:hypothetical protein